MYIILFHEYLDTFKQPLGEPQHAMFLILICHVVDFSAVAHQRVPCHSLSQVISNLGEDLGHHKFDQLNRLTPHFLYSFLSFSP
jgi:hypothetical protein